MLDMERLQERYKKFWNLENETPILNLKGWKENPPEMPVPPSDITASWCDVEYVIKEEKAYMNSFEYIGDAVMHINPNLGPDLFGATFGADLIFEKTTSYSVPFIEDWTEKLEFQPENQWWKKIKEITNAFVEDSQGEYLVGITDLHPGSDGLVSLRGPQNMCFDVYDQPEVFKNAEKILLPVFKTQFNDLYAMTQKYQQGTINWMGLYKEEPWYPVSCDFSCMVSHEDFKKLILPEIRQEIEFLNGNAIFHLDGPDALKHLDSLLEIPNLAGIQWVYGAGQPSAKYWIDVLKKIQNAGKIINIGLKAEDIDVVFSELKAQGLSCYFDFDYTAEEAKEILQKINRYYK